MRPIRPAAAVVLCSTRAARPAAGGPPHPTGTRGLVGWLLLLSLSVDPPSFRLLCSVLCVIAFAMNYAAAGREGDGPFMWCVSLSHC